MDLIDRLWAMDKERSFARFTVIPIVRGKERYYQCYEEIAIRPYPNPLSYGGMWGSSTAEALEEVEKLKADFLKSWVEPMRKYGLERIEIEERPETRYEEYQEEISRRHKPQSQDRGLPLFSKL